jgi:hypothetical protein
MSDIALRDTDSWADILPAVGDLAGKISTTNFVPKGLRGKPAEIAACILTGREVGIGPMESLAKIHVIDGRPSMSAELMRSLVMRDGHEIRYPTLTDAKVVAEGRRANSEDWTTITWTMSDAQRIGVAGRDTWKKYPRQMLTARATSELCRILFPDALGGISYTPEELGDLQEGPDSPTEARSTTVRRRKVPSDIQTPPEKIAPQIGSQAPEPIQPSTDPEIIDAEVVDETPPPKPAKGAITGPQIKMLGALMNQAGIAERQAALDYCADVIGRQIESRNDLSTNEATQIIEALTLIVPTDDGDE